VNAPKVIHIPEKSSNYGLVAIQVQPIALQGVKEQKQKVESRNGNDTT
jgi:hypothetical protein